MSPAKGLNDIEAQIAALEAKLGGIDSEEEDRSDDESNSGDSDSGRRAAGDKSKSKKSKKEKKEKKEKKSKKSKKSKRAREDNSSDSESLEPIASLPSHLLPEHSGYAGKGKGKRRKTKTPGFVESATMKMAGNDDANGNDADRTIDPFAKAVGVVQPPPIMAILAKRKNLPRCEVCQKDFTSQNQLDEHQKGKAHWRAARNAAAAAAGQSVQTGRTPGGAGRGGGRSVTGGRGGVTGGLGAGRGGFNNSSHVHTPKPPDGPHCALCRKTFTSAAQLTEHNGGKWHKQRVAGTLAPSTRPYNSQD